MNQILNRWSWLSNRPFVWLSVSLLMALFLLVRMPLPVHFDVSLDARKFFPSLRQGILFATVIVLWFAAYGRLLILIRRGLWRPSFKTVVALAIGLLVVVVLIYPFNANDIYRYVLRGRITAFYGGNPFSEPISAFPAGSLYDQAGEWVDFTSPYGPVWELLATLPLKGVPNRPLGQLLGFKVITAASFLLTGGLIFVARQKGAGTPAGGVLPAAAWLLNPGLLLIFGADGHNDAVMLLLLVLGWLVVERGVSRHSWGWTAAGGLILWLAPLVKAIALLPLPLIALYALRSFPRWSDRLKMIGVTLLGIVTMTTALFWPFGSPFELANRLLIEASAGASFTPLTLAILLQQHFGTATIALWETVSLGGTMAGALWVAWRVWRGRSPLQGAADLFMIYLLLAFNFRLWYTAWPFAFLLLDSNTARFRLTAGHLFLLVGQLSVFVFGHLWVGPFDRDLLLTYLVGIPFVFVLPIALAQFRMRSDE